MAQRKDLAEIRIPNVKPELRDNLKNISENLGYAVASKFLKEKLQSISDSYPADMKKKRSLDPND